MIRKATLDDLKTVKSITDACGKHMRSLGIYQWNEHYPSEAVFQEDIEKGVLYVLEHHGTVCGCIMFSDFKDAVYTTVRWLTSDGNNLYIHRLAVHPRIQKKGFGKKLIEYAEKHAVENNYDSIRLDTFSQNEANQRFYESKGYERLGAIFFPKQSEDPFYCYEKILVSS